MERKRPITEDDVLLTELLLARSYSCLKQSVMQASSDAVGSAVHSLGGTVKKHPVATAGAAIGTGIILYGLFRLMIRSSPGEPGSCKDFSRPGMTMDILSLLMPLILPYLTAYLEKYLGRRSART